MLVFNKLTVLALFAVLVALAYDQSDASSSSSRGADMDAGMDAGLGLAGLAVGIAGSYATNFSVILLPKSNDVYEVGKPFTILFDKPAMYVRMGQMRIYLEPEKGANDDNRILIFEGDQSKQVNDDKHPQWLHNHYDDKGKGQYHFDCVVPKDPRLQLSDPKGLPIHYYVRLIVWRRQNFVRKKPKEFVISSPAFYFIANQADKAAESSEAVLNELRETIKLLKEKDNVKTSSDSDKGKSDVNADKSKNDADSFSADKDKNSNGKDSS